MRIKSVAGLAVSMIALVMTAGGAAFGQDVCQNFGPQTPRDISVKAGSNPRPAPLAPAASAMNLCNIHFHSNAEHKGPGFKVFAGKGEHGGYKCNLTDQLTAAELKAPEHGACHGLKPGDTIEVHWVHTSCAVTPGKGLESCSSKACANPVLRVEAQVAQRVPSHRHQAVVERRLGAGARATEYAELERHCGEGATVWLRCGATIEAVVRYAYHIATARNEARVASAIKGTLLIAFFNWRNNGIYGPRGPWPSGTCISSERAWLPCAKVT